MRLAHLIYCIEGHNDLDLFEKYIIEKGFILEKIDSCRTAIVHNNEELGCYDKIWPMHLSVSVKSNSLIEVIKEYVNSRNSASDSSPSDKSSGQTTAI